MAEIRTVNLTKVYGSLRAVDNLTYTFHDGKVTCLLGPSGCGKTTLLRMIAGLEFITSGKIYFGNKEVTPLPTSARNIGMVFQYPVVYRGLTVEENIALPLIKEKLEKKDIDERVDEAIKLLAIEDVRKKEAWALPSVLRQKVAVAREVARRPDIILFDEPLTNVDASSKALFKRSFKELTQKLNQTIIYVTHDQTEAMTFGDYIALMDKGKIVQYDSPRVLYGQPKEVFGGWFLGNPGMNFFEPKVEQLGNKYKITTDIFEKDIVTDLPDSAKKKMSFGIRPEHIMVRNEPIGEHSIKVKLKQKWITVGGQYLLTAQVGDIILRIKALPEIGRDIRDEFFCYIPMDKVFAYDSEGINFKLNLN